MIRLPLMFALLGAWPMGLAVTASGAETAEIRPTTTDESTARDSPSTGIAKWSEALDEQLLDYYQLDDPATADVPAVVTPTSLLADFGDSARSLVTSAMAQPTPERPLPLVAGTLRGRVQQAVALELGRAVAAGDVVRAQALRCVLPLPRGVSASEGSLLLQGLRPTNANDVSKLLVREAITWQTTRVRQLLDQAAHSAGQELPMPGRLLEQLGEATALAEVPPPLARAAGIERVASASSALTEDVARVRSAKWPEVLGPLTELRRELLERLPSLLTDAERSRRERLLLKLVQIIPQEYSAGVRDGQVVVPLEYREAVSFTQQARQIHGELTPLWLAEHGGSRGPAANALERLLEEADAAIAAKRPASDLSETLAKAASVLTNDFGVSLRRSGTTADIVDEVMLETRTLLSASLSASLRGAWVEAERSRVDAYTTYDPELEARLMPRDPQLALDIERLLLDGIDEPGVKALLDRRAPAAELEAGYARVSAALDKAAALLKSGISPTAAALNAGSIVLREGLEGLLVIVAIFAGLRGRENARRRRLFWLGIVASLAATAATWVVSQTILTSLRAYGEVIAAVTGLLAIGVLLLITNWLFHQVYWRKWVSTLKTQAAEGERSWQLISVGFLVGYREGFETVLFLQSLMLDAGGQAVSLGVAVGGVLLVIMGVAALYVGLKLPYLKILLVTAALIGVVLITFVGGTVRASQTVGWLPVHRMMNGSWPAWTGTWFGLYNTWESFGSQLATALIVLATWRFARFQAKRKGEQRRAIMAERSAAQGPKYVGSADPGLVCASAVRANPVSGCDPSACDPTCQGQSSHPPHSPLQPSASFSHLH